MKSESGSAVVDLVLYGVVLQAGLLAFGMPIYETQANQLAVESIARHSLRAFVLSDVQVQSSAEQILRDFGIYKSPIVKLFCEPDCESEGSVVGVQASLGSVSATSVMVR